MIDAVLACGAVCIGAGFLLSANRLALTPYNRSYDDEDEAMPGFVSQLASWPTAAIANVLVWEFARFWTIAIFLGGLIIGANLCGAWIAMGRRSNAAAKRIRIVLTLMPIATLICLAATAGLAGQAAKYGPFKDLLT